MFDIGFSEMLLIGLIALIVLGPKRLPEAARSAGQWVGKLRRFVENVKRDIDAEIEDEDLAAFKQMHAELSETRNLLQKSAVDAFSNFSGAVNEVAPASEPVAVVKEFAPLTMAPAETNPPAAPARKPVVKKPVKASRKGVAKTVSKNVTTKKAAIKKVAIKTNRITHGGVKKTRAR